MHNFKATGAPDADILFEQTALSLIELPLSADFISTGPMPCHQTTWVIVRASSRCAMDCDYT